MATLQEGEVWGDSGSEASPQAAAGSLPPAAAGHMPVHSPAISLDSLRSSGGARAHAAANAGGGSSLAQHVPLPLPLPAQHLKTEMGGPHGHAAGAGSAGNPLWSGQARSWEPPPAPIQQRPPQWPASQGQLRTEPPARQQQQGDGAGGGAGDAPQQQQQQQQGALVRGGSGGFAPRDMMTSPQALESAAVELAAGGVTQFLWTREGALVLQACATL